MWQILEPQRNVDNRDDAFDWSLRPKRLWCELDGAMGVCCCSLFEKFETRIRIAGCDGSREGWPVWLMKSGEAHC